MKSRDLLSAIGKIDDKYVKSAEKCRNTEDKKRVFSIIRTVAAAVFAVAVIGAVWVISYKNVITKISPADTAAGNQTDPDPAAALSIVAAAEICLSERSDDNRVFYARDKTSIYRDDLRHIYFCMRVGTDYVMQAMEYGRDYPDGPDGCEISGYQFYYPAGYGLIFVNAADGAEHHLYNAYYDEKLINDEELSQVYHAYNEFINIFYSYKETDEASETTGIPPEEAHVLYFNETDNITNKDKAAELKKLFDNYLSDKSNTGGVIEFCVKLSDSKYAAMLNNVFYVIPASKMQHIDVAGGYPIIVVENAGESALYKKIIVLSGDDIFYGAETAYNRGLISDDDALNIFKACKNKYREKYNNETVSLLYRCITDYLNGKDEADNKSGNFSKTLYNSYVYIDFCYRLSDKKYAVLYSVYDEPSADYESMDVDIKGYKFIYKNGNTLWVYDDGKIYDASHANLTDDEAARLYEVYNRYINQ